ncbi:helix-turn-helix domain-containing protein [Elizabethkingia anophelis]|nr:helix-turn-helix domain-containing protein [Elizabethkingia anophelis]
MANEEIIFALQELDEKINTLSLSAKEILNFEEAAIYLQTSRSYLYKLTSSKTIPHYKPTGKLIFFKKSELDEWIMSGKQKTKEETSQIYLSNLGKKYSRAEK